MRLRRAATLARKIPAIEKEIGNAILAFDAVLSALQRMRNVAEHFDDYATDSGRDRSVERHSLEVFAIDGVKVEWLDVELDADAAMAAAEQLFQTLQSAKSSVPLDN